MEPRLSSYFGAVFIFLALALFSSTSTRASEITLKLINGELVVSGTLVKFNGSFYVVDSKDFGTITVDARKFVCVSGNCPKDATPQAVEQAPVKRAGNDFSIRGSNTIGAQLMPALIESFAETINAKITRIVGTKPEEIKLLLNSQDGKRIASIDLRSHGSGTSAPALASGEAQIGMSSRPVKEKEIQQLKKAGIEDITEKGNENILALDGLIIFVSPANPIQSLSIEQIGKIFAGEIRDWSQVGRPKPGPINIYARDSKSGTYDTFKSLVLEPLKLKISSQAKRYESSPDLSDDTANDPDGIGFAGFAYKRNAKVLSISSVCGISNQATLFDMKTEEYPLSRRLYLYTAPRVLTSPVAQKILDYSLSDQAQSIIPRVGYVNQSIQTLHFNKQGDRVALALNAIGEEFNLDLLRDFTKEFSNAERLSVTFRFKKGTQLSNKSQADLARFIKLLESSAFRGKQIFLVGFSDNRGAFVQNKELALKRALFIKFAILSAGSKKIDIDNLKLKTFGELFPVACNETIEGQEKNRRVEVWVK